MQFPNHTTQRNINPVPNPINKNTQSMTREEIQIAISFLKIRFRDSSVDDIIASLTRHLQHQKQSERINRQVRESRLYNRISPQQLEDLNESTFGFDRTREMIDDSIENENGFGVTEGNERKLINLEQTRMVALIFRTAGINYATIRELLPNMSVQRYRETIDKINNEAFKSIQVFLRDQCNINIQYITAEQKKVLIKHLQKVRDWLGKINMGDLDTYYKFIERQYEKRAVEVTYDQAIRIYKTLLKIVKSPRAERLDEQIDDNRQNTSVRMRSISEMSMPQLIPPQRQTACLQKTAVIEQYTKQELKQIVNQYLRHKNIKMASHSLQKSNKKRVNQIKWNEQSIKWNEQSIKCVLKYAIKKTVQKIKTFACEKKYTQQPVLFGTSEQQIKALLQSQYFKQTLLKAYTNRTISARGLSGLIRSINKYLNKRKKDESSSLQIKIEDNKEADNIQPKLQILQGVANRTQERVKEQVGLEGGDGWDKMTEATQGEVKEQFTNESRRNYSFDEIIEID